MGEHFARGLAEYNLCPVVDDHGHKLRTLGVLIKNCWRAPVMMYSGLYYCCAGNYIYTDPPDHFHYNINKGMFDTIVVTISMLDVYLTPAEKKEIRVIKNVIIEEETPPEFITRLKNLGITIFYFNDIVEKGKTSTYKFERPTRDTPIIIVSTSGSTGMPKGAVLNDSGLLDNAALEVGPWHDHLSNDAYMLNNVTLGFGTVLGFNFATMCRGGKLVYLEKKFANYFEELKAGDPSFIILSPLSYAKMYQAINMVISKLPSPQKEGITAALSAKTKLFYATKKYLEPEIDKMLKPLRDKFFGNRLKFMVNIGAAISDDILTFFRIFSCVKIINSYGSCDVGGIVTVSSDTESAEFAGVPVPWYQFKLIDVPELNYFVTDTIDGKLRPRGEVNNISQKNV